MMIDFRALNEEMMGDAYFSQYYEDIEPVRKRKIF